jgi:hypothetical protein
VIFRLFCGPLEEGIMNASRRMQMQIPLPYGRELKDDEQVSRQLARGWHIAQLQRLSDQEVLVTFEAV